MPVVEGPPPPGLVVEDGAPVVAGLVVVVVEVGGGGRTAVVVVVVVVIAAVVVVLAPPPEPPRLIGTPFREHRSVMMRYASVTVGQRCGNGTSDGKKADRAGLSAKRQDRLEH